MMNDRNKEIYRDRKNGMTARMVAEKYGISEIRVYQIGVEQEEEALLAGNDLFEAIKKIEPDKYAWIWSILKRGGVTSLEELQRCDIKQIKRIRGCGAKAFDIIQRIKEIDT